MKKISYFLILFAAAMVVYFVGGYYAAIPHGFRTVIKVSLPALLLAATWACGRSESSWEFTKPVGRHSPGM